MASLLQSFYTDTIRFRELNVSKASSCSHSCSEAWGHLPDETNLPEMMAFYDEHTRLYASRSSAVHIGVSYDFDRKKWLNDFSKSELSSTIWAGESFGLIDKVSLTDLLIMGDSTP